LWTALRGLHTRHSPHTLWPDTPYPDFAKEKEKRNPLLKFRISRKVKIKKIKRKGIEMMRRHERDKDERDYRDKARGLRRMT
jgi:cellulose biosynthesis protein BcsQ